MISNGGIFGSSAVEGFLDAGVYADDSDGYNTLNSGANYWKRHTVSFWYRNDYANTIGTFLYGAYHGGLPNSWPVSNLSGSPSWSYKGVTYMAQLVITAGTSPHAVTDVLNSSDGTAIDVLDTDGSGTDLVTNRSGSIGGSGFWLYGANSTTSSLTHNSATDGQGDSSFSSSGFALSTSGSIFPVTGITT